MSSWNKTAATGERCVIELPLSYSRHQHDTLDKMFRIANNMKNNLIAWYSRQLTEMMRTRIWRSNQKALADLYSEYVDEVEHWESFKRKSLGKRKMLGRKKRFVFSVKMNSSWHIFNQGWMNSQRRKRPYVCFATR